MDISEEIIRYPLRILKWCGQNPGQNKKTVFRITTLYSFFTTITLSFVLAQIIYANGDVIVVAQSCEAFAVYFQTMGKSLNIAFKIQNFRKMITETKQFWNTKNHPVKCSIKIENTFGNILKLERLFFRASIFTAILVMSSSYFLKQLPLGLWVMKNHNSLYKFALVVQRGLVPWVVVFTAGCEGLFLSFCVDLWGQFKMLQDCWRSLHVSTILSKTEEEAYWNKLMTYIKHHEFLLRFSKDLRDAYSPIMVIVYFTLVLMYFAEMYILLERYDKLNFSSFLIKQISMFQGREAFLLIRHASALVCVVIQLSFYCIPLNYITDEAVLVSQGIYESDWYSKQIPNLRNIVPFVIHRSQKEIVFTAGGLVEMNCRTVLNVVRFSYSVCTVIRAMKSP